jgi:quercetin dioxygenase-like cupin family protein
MIGSLRLNLEKKNNGRKVLINELFPSKEFPIQNPLWHFGPTDGKTPVLGTGFGGVEIATFTHEAGQDRHKHLIGTEIYTVLEGKMSIRAEDQDPDIELEAGDEIVISPNTIHEVINKGATKFLCRVHSINCYGDRDKYVEDVNGAWWQVFTLRNQKDFEVKLKK